MLHKGESRVYYVLQQEIAEELWKDYLKHIDLDNIMVDYLVMKQHREEGTGPNTHWRLIQRTDVIVETSTPTRDECDLAAIRDALKK